MTLDLALRLLNVLFIPILFYVVSIERRMTRLETKCQIYFDTKSVGKDG